ncbi:MAG: HAD family hydrolase [Caldilineaceae bacterium]|nr:HAD family hydrolase [Caldilineaceae bacterium]
MIDTILFDLDGTLVQHSHVLLPEKLADWGHPRPAAVVETAFTTQIHWFYEYAAQVQGTAQDTPETWQRIWPIFYRRITESLEIDDAAISEQMAFFFADEPTPPLFEDTLPLLKELADGPWHLGVITQRGRLGATRFLRDHGLLDSFGILVAGDDGFGRKPAPDPFHHALGYLRCRADRAIFVGDRLDDDCGGACSAGLRAFLIDRHGVYLEDGERPTEIQFTRLATLLELLEHIPIQGSGHD